MINLARRYDRDHPVADPEIQEIVRQELTQADCHYTEQDVLLHCCGEVPTSILGLQSKWSFQRAWAYWVAKGPGIPSEIAEEFHKTWGQQVRVDGHCGCPSPLEWFEGFGVDSYHIDTQEGLNAFVALLKTIHKPRTKDSKYYHEPTDA